MEIVSNRQDNSSINESGDSESPLSYQLYEAVVLGDAALAQKLIDAGADVDYEHGGDGYLSETCLLAAISSENCGTVELLLAYGADPHLTNNCGETPLRIAIATGNLETIKCIIDHGADVNSQSGMDYEIPLIDAAASYHDSVVTHSIILLLLRYGANPYKKNGSGENLFAFAKRCNYSLPPELVEKPQENVFETVGRAVTGWFQRK